MRKLVLTDSVKLKSFNTKSSFGIDPWQDETPGVWTPDIAASSLAQSARLVPSMYAGIYARAQALADMPFSIYTLKDGATVDDSARYQNAVGFLPKPSQFIWMVEASMCTTGCAYFYRAPGQITGKLRQLNYWMTETVVPTINKVDGLTGFHRTVDYQEYKPEQVLHFWWMDPGIEVGPPRTYPFAAALAAAEAAGAITGWARDFMKRGAIKAMLLAVDGLPPAGEIERMEKWFNRFMAGVRGLYWRVFNADNVKPIIIGDGLDALKGLTISSDLRYEVHTAFGTRHLLEDENLATANARERQFINFTIMPDAHNIQQTLNDQILGDMGYRLEFEPERLNSFEVLKAERAASLANLFDVLIQSVTPDVALELGMDLLGYDLTEEQRRLFKAGMAAREAGKTSIAPESERVVTKDPQRNEPIAAGGKTSAQRQAEAAAVLANIKASVRDYQRRIQ